MPSSSEPHLTARPRTTALGAFLEGWRRAIHAPHVVFGVLVVTIGVSLPLAALLHRVIEWRIGSSLIAEDALRGWSDVWATEIGVDERGVAVTLTREILGFGGTLATIAGLLDGEPVPPALVGSVAAYLLVWVALSGGVIDRLARARPVGSTMFLATCGRFFFRLLRLGLVGAFGYWLLFRYVHPFFFVVGLAWVFDENVPETTTIVWRVGFYLLFFVFLAALTIVVDMTRVRLVVEDRRSVLASIGAACRFVRRRPGRMAWLFLLNLIGQAIVLRLWLQIAPGAASATWAALLAAQIVLVARIWARLAFIASEVVFFQGELAHATYTAPRPAVWPDSASIEAVRNLQSSQPPRPPNGLG